MKPFTGTVAYHLVYAELVRAAVARELTTYTKIAEAGRLHTMGHAMGQDTKQVLNDITDQELAEGRPMLSAVCVGASGEPGDGFYATARRLGRLAPDGPARVAEFWREELERVYDAWAKP